jgi:hypothetical protein
VTPNTERSFATEDDFLADLLAALPETGGAGIGGPTVPARVLISPDVIRPVMPTLVANAASAPTVKVDERVTASQKV